MKMYIRPVDQGQVAEVSYGYDSAGGAYRRTIDRSEPPGSPEGEDENSAPCVFEWTRIATPEAP